MGSASAVWRRKPSTACSGTAPATCSSGVATAGAAKEPGGSLQACQRLLEAPALLPELAAWRRDCKESVWTPPPWKSDELHVDGSGRQPNQGAPCVTHRAGYFGKVR